MFGFSKSNKVLNSKDKKDEYIGRKSGTLAERFKDTKKSDYIKFGILALVTILFMLWTGNPAVLLFLLFFLDVYVTRYVAWDWWKKSENSVLKTVGSWVDALIFALAVVYPINIYLFQNYVIPSSSLEKTLLVGDYLFVSKCNYGPRSPMTPLSFPLAQHTLPVLNCKSYIENPQWEYKRLAGLEDVKLYDIVVFNFPAGDTVAMNVQNPDYYTLVSMYGRDKVWEDKATFGDIVWRPVDRRENYVKRCVGLPGDNLLISDKNLYINGKFVDAPEHVQYNYFVEATTLFSEKTFEALGVSKADYEYCMVSTDWKRMLQYKANEDGTYNYVYKLPLTAAMKSTLEKRQDVVSIKIEDERFGGHTFPQTKADNKWTRDNYGPIHIPARGETIELNADNIDLYAQAIRNYEGNKLEYSGGDIKINGETVSSYTFKMNYYWMMGDNRHNSADSRYWGFVPEDHIVGKPIFIWLSIDDDKTGFFNRIRTERIFKRIHND
ncbi:MAG: signal peptidase I [Paludibacteraceae bacterium]|nr:signal peptidase I [Paludibacteraceae bacterium]